MYKSPAQLHYERITATMAAAAAGGPGATMEGASAYELMLAKLANDKRRLSSIKSIQAKVVVKRELLPEYAEYVAGALQGGRGAQDSVLTTIMVWRLDAGDFAGALDLAAYVLKHKLALPDEYERTPATVIVEQFADAALVAMKAGEPFDTEQLMAVEQLTQGYDMHDQVRAKLYKALGYATRVEQPTTALVHLRRALQLDDRIGVKMDIERIEKDLAKTAQEEAAKNDTGGSEQDPAKATEKAAT